MLTNVIPPFQRSRDSVLFPHYGKSICFAESTIERESKGCSYHQSEQPECDLRESYGRKCDYDRFHHLLFRDGADSRAKRDGSKAGDEGSCNAPDYVRCGTYRGSPTSVGNTQGKTSRTWKDEPHCHEIRTSFGYDKMSSKMLYRITSRHQRCMHQSMPSINTQRQMNTSTRPLLTQITLIGAWTQ